MNAATSRILAGKYQLLEQIGRGGFSRVYRGVHLGMRRPVAIKLMEPRLDGIAAARHEAALEDFARRFAREAQLLSQLRHPATVTLYDYGHTEEGDAYMVLELVEGRSLNALDAHELPMAPERVVKLLRQALESLREAHILGILHRDIKPSNLMLYERLGEHDLLKVLDFGMAKVYHSADMADASHTQQGVIVGTPRYMAPEQIDPDQEIGPATDLYSLGLVCYELLTGMRAFEGGDALTLLTAQLDPTSVTLPGSLLMPRALREIINRMLQKDLRYRWREASEVLDALEELDGTPRRRQSAHVESTRPSIQVDRRLLNLGLEEEGEEPPTLTGDEDVPTREMARLSMGQIAAELRAMHPPVHDAELRATAEMPLEDLREISEATRDEAYLRETSEVDGEDIRALLSHGQEEPAEPIFDHPFAADEEAASQTLELGRFELPAAMSWSDLGEAPASKALGAKALGAKPLGAKEPSLDLPAFPLPISGKTAPKLSLSRSGPLAEPRQAPAQPTFSLKPQADLPAPPIHSVARTLHASAQAAASLPPLADLASSNPFAEVAHTVAAPLSELDAEWDEAEITNANLRLDALRKPERVIMLSEPKVAVVPDAPLSPSAPVGEQGLGQPDARQERLIVLNQRVADRRTQTSSLTAAELTPVAPVAVRRKEQLDDAPEIIEEQPAHSRSMFILFVIAAILVVVVAFMAASCL